MPTARKFLIYQLRSLNPIRTLSYSEAFLGIPHSFLHLSIARVLTFHWYSLGT